MYHCAVLVSSHCFVIDLAPEEWVIPNLGLTLPARQPRGHSTTTWTKCYPSLTPYTPEVDKHGHLTYHLAFVMWPPWSFYWPPPPLFVHVVIEWPPSCTDASIGGLCNTTLKGDSEYNELEFFLIGAFLRGFKLFICSKTFLILKIEEMSCENNVYV